MKDSIETEIEQKVVKHLNGKDKQGEVYFDKIPNNEYMCIEVPGKVKEGTKGMSAIESLGGLRKISTLFKYLDDPIKKKKYDEKLILKINSKDRFSSFIAASFTKVQNILIRVKRTKKKNYKIECLGNVRYFYYFENMCDFYYIPSFYNRHNFESNYIRYVTERKMKEKKNKKKKKKKNIERKEDYNMMEKIIDNGDINENTNADINITTIDSFNLFHPYVNCHMMKQLYQPPPTLLENNYNYKNINENWSFMNRTLNNQTTTNNNSTYPMNQYNIETNNPCNAPIGTSPNINNNDNNNNNIEEVSNKNFIYSQSVPLLKENEKKECVYNIHETEYNADGSQRINEMNPNETQDNDNDDNNVNKRSFYENRYSNYLMNYSVNEKIPKELNNHCCNPVLMEENINAYDKTPIKYMEPINYREKLQNLNVFLSDKEIEEMNEILTLEMNQGLLEERKEESFSTDESEGYELHCNIQSKNISPFDYSKYETSVTQKYLRNCKHLISKFTSPIYAHNETKPTDVEKLLKELIGEHDEEESVLNQIMKQGIQEYSNEKKEEVSEDHNEEILDEIEESVSNSEEEEEEREGENEMKESKSMEIHNKSKKTESGKSVSNASNVLKKDKDPKEMKENVVVHSSSKKETFNLGDKIIVSKKTEHCNQVAKFEDDVLPIGPLEIAVKRYTSEKLFNEVKTLFTIRPLWSRNALLEHIGDITTYCTKVCLSKICFYFIDGPWRCTYCKYGYDPRKDPSSFIYQTIDFRDNFYRGIKNDDIDLVNRNILKKEKEINEIVTNFIKDIVKTAKEKNQLNKIQKKNQSNEKEKVEDKIKLNKEKNTNHTDDENKHSMNDTQLYHEDNEINDILYFLHKSKTLQYMKKFTANSHFSITPLKVSSVYQYIDIFDRKISNHLSNIQAQKFCTKENGWLKGEDISKIREILYVRASTLRRAHS